MKRFLFIHKKTGELALFESEFGTLTYARMQMGKDFEYLEELEKDEP